MGYTDGRPALTEALTASHYGALGDKCHLVEAACKHEGSHTSLVLCHISNIFFIG